MKDFFESFWLKIKKAVHNRLFPGQPEINKQADFIGLSDAKLPPWGAQEILHG